MDVDHLLSLLNDPGSEPPEELRTWGVQNVGQAKANLQRIYRSGVSLDLMVALIGQLGATLSQVSDPDMALNNLERFTVASRSPLGLVALWDRDPKALPLLLKIFAASQHLSDVLIREPEIYDLLRVTEGQPVSRQMLVDDITSELDTIHDERSAMAALRLFKQRETLRIAYGDLVGLQRIDIITRQISYLADAICHAAVRFARRQQERRRGVPLGPHGEPVPYCVLALGKLGGEELNYSSDIDLICLYDGDGFTQGGRSVTHQEFFERLTQDVVRMLAESTELGSVYRVDLRLRPHGRTGPLVSSREALLQYYDLKGRTWERQAFVKARPIAGDVELGEHFLLQMQPWIYRTYLSHADINGICALKRQIEGRALQSGRSNRNVKEGHGGIRDIEFTIQFLQLLNGNDLPNVRTGNTLRALGELANSGCLTLQERGLLEDSYVFLRRVEHRLQLLFDLQTHELPEEETELRKLARRLDYEDQGVMDCVTLFRRDYLEKTEVNRKILNFLLHDAFALNTEVAPETDLILNPDPSEDQILQVLGPYRFRDLPKAYESLKALSVETIPFLPQQRCRHFLASVLPDLLPLVAATPDPDSTLISLEKVSQSIGGKGLLWELFSYNPPSMDLYVRLCAACPYLTGILTRHPGMIDELLDSLMMDRLPTKEGLQRELAELCRGAEDLEPILHAFKHSNHLRVGVRDILGKEDIVQTHAALSDIAEVLLRQIVDFEYQELTKRLGTPSRLPIEPTTIEATTAIEPGECEFIVLGMGKLGGAEPNYHSDLDLIFLYEFDGMTLHADSKKATTHQFFFNQLAVKVLTRLNHLGPFGRLYETDARLRPTGQSGMLVVPIGEFNKYFETGQGQLWERQSLCKARAVYGSPRAAEKAMAVVRHAMLGTPWKASDATEIASMRDRMQMNATEQNLKRGVGGTVDVEFCVQMLQLRYGAENPDLFQSGTLASIQALERAQIFSREESEALRTGYHLLRSVESRLRLMNTTARHDLPTTADELTRLAYVLRRDDVDELCNCLAEMRRIHRRIFQETVARLAAE
jgi:glutamate-ammonia-ligase adenylyltransferase